MIEHLSSPAFYAGMMAGLLLAGLVFAGLSVYFFRLFIERDCEVRE